MARATSGRESLLQFTVPEGPESMAAEGGLVTRSRHYSRSREVGTPFWNHKQEAEISELSGRRILTLKTRP